MNTAAYKIIKIISLFLIFFLMLSFFTAKKNVVLGDFDPDAGAVKEGPLGLGKFSIWKPTIQTDSGQLVDCKYVCRVNARGSPPSREYVDSVVEHERLDLSNNFKERCNRIDYMSLENISLLYNCPEGSCPLFIGEWSFTEEHGLFSGYEKIQITCPLVGCFPIGTRVYSHIYGAGSPRYITWPPLLTSFYEYRTNLISNLCDPAINPLAHSTECKEPDGMAANVCKGQKDKDGQPLWNNEPERSCSYYVCDRAGFWRQPTEPSVLKNCTLNPIFRYYILSKGREATLETSGVPTAIGCFPSTIEGIVTVLLRIFMGISGLVALLIIIISILTIMTNPDSPEKVKESYSRITYAVIGLIMMILSVFILRFIGINILNLPKFGATILSRL